MSAITEHICEQCESCRGASAHHDNHYALGRLRIRITDELGPKVAGLPINELLERWHTRRASGHE